MSAVVDGWTAEAVDLKKQGLDTDAIAEAVGKSAPTVRKAIAKAREAGEVFPGDDTIVSNGNGNGNGHGTVDAETAARLRAAAGSSDGTIPGQTTVDEQLAGRDPLDDFRDEAGEAVGDMPPQTPPEPMETVLPEIEITGTAQLGLFDAGGRSPDSASVRLAGGKISTVAGTAFEKGTVIHFEGTAVITAVKQQDKRDPKTGTVVGCEQQHTALITDLSLAS